MSLRLTQPLPADMNLEGLAEIVARWQHKWTIEWHRTMDPLVRPPSPLAVVVQEQHVRNFKLWHEEDKAREPDADNNVIAEVKRRIDKLNQERNNLIESLDENFLTMLHQRGLDVPPDLPWNSETPGSCIDRLSIISLKVYHMQEQADRADAGEEHQEKCASKVKVLEQQRLDLVTALQVLLNDIFEGRKQMKLYRQYKMYNDPGLNPSIYNKDKKE